MSNPPPYNESFNHPNLDAPPNYQHNQPLLPQTNSAPPPISGNTYRFTSAPARVQCQICGTEQVTIVEKRNGLLTWGSAAALCLFGLSLGCCLIPFCLDECKDTVHICSNCHREIGLHAALKL
eukprot:TRINITY_DN29892_c0_g1_i1.p1 TRINITY_DN29892_c0_g1~~TRINITY_DN29892_c0_g1_i1.p1  ORF type:complete len:144 (-),score=6.57 TRINITY_DN29892_c0_g1_i1:103-471(-)